MNIDQSIIDEIINKNDIVEVISKFLKLKKSGANYFACCPFHQEKSASFSVNANKQYFHCFGCGESGNVINFVMKYNGWDFIDTIKYLAQLAGVYLKESTINREQAIKKKQHKITIQDTLRKVVNYYKNHLINSSVASHYLKNRGLNSEVITKFELGFAPNIKNPLANLFKDYLINQFIQDSGLVIKSEEKIYDRFRDRIMFPIKNIKGEYIGFGGRIITHGEPKYLNSPETELFNKSEELYGLYEAGRAIRDNNQAIVVEGYMDVIALVQYGISNTVASMGTAATEGHIKKLFRICDNIYFCFDGDTAGQKAAWRALERSIKLVTDLKSVYFTFLPQNEDPDSFIRQNGADNYKEYIKNHSLSMSDFLLKQLSQEINITNNEGRAKLISLIKPYIEQTNAIALQVILKQQLAKLVELEPSTLESILNNRSRYAFYTNRLSNNSFTKNSPIKSTNLPILKNNELLAQTAIQHIDWVIKYKLPDNIAIFRREYQELAILLDYIANNYQNNEIDLKPLFETYYFNSLNLNSILNSKSTIKLTHDEFIKMLDIAFGYTKPNVNKTPKIPMKNN